MVPDWFGIPSRIGRVTVWLPVQEVVGSYRSFSILVLLPKDDLQDAPPFIHVGAQFLLEHQARVMLDGGSGDSHLLFPDPASSAPSAS
jgi:hypothetical protein